jgi:hypothetical protein
MDPDFDAWQSELNHLRSLGYLFQEQGRTAVKTAESGLANLANYQKAFNVASGSGAFPAVQQKMNECGLSGALAISSLQVTNEALNSAKGSIHSSSISALTGVTLANGSESKPQAETDLANVQVTEFTALVNSFQKVAHGSQSLSKDQVDLGMRKIEELLYLILSRWQDA